MSHTVKHTPGPWRIDPATGRIVADSMSVGRAVALDVAKTFPRGGQVETNANARLIAAAPDLLAALRETLAFARALEKQGSKGTGGRRGGHIFAKAEAAITKAEENRSGRI